MFGWEAGRRNQFCRLVMWQLTRETGTSSRRRSGGAATSLFNANSRNVELQNPPPKNKRPHLAFHHLSTETVTPSEPRERVGGSSAGCVS